MLSSAQKTTSIARNVGLLLDGVHRAVDPPGVYDCSLSFFFRSMVSIRLGAGDRLLGKR